jgi:CO/xanthine dehydrogenase Mo-binding subunit
MLVFDQCYVMAEDCGRVINPLIVDVQVRSGA